MSRARMSRAVSRPNRCNFAGVCIWCGQKGCQSRACLARHLESVWVVCPRCGGGEIDPQIIADAWDDPLSVLGVSDLQAECGCVFGVVQVPPPAVVPLLEAAA